MSKRNWRYAETSERTRAAFPDFTHEVQFKLDGGGWVNPDCAYECLFCGGCLGCIRKLYHSDMNEDKFDCPTSPDGDHHCAYNAEAN
jgi:hypothetical protein